MAKGKNAQKNGHCGREYASRRPYSWVGHGRIVKDLTHRKERVLRKVALRAEIERE
jgi:hypothetical protein